MVMPPSTSFGWTLPITAVSTDGRGRSGPPSVRRTARRDARARYFDGREQMFVLGRRGRGRSVAGVGKEDGEIARMDTRMTPGVFAALICGSVSWERGYIWV